MRKLTVDARRRPERTSVVIRRRASCVDVFATVRQGFESSFVKVATAKCRPTGRHRRHKRSNRSRCSLHTYVALPCLRGVPRRAHMAAAESGAAGVWSDRVVRLDLQWVDHVERSRHPAPQLRAQPARWHTRDWRAARRLRAGSLAAAAGRIDSRAERGNLALRWHDVAIAAPSLPTDVGHRRWLAAPSVLWC